MSEKVGLYDASYGHFADEAYAAVRREAFGEDLGQNSWLTTPELDRFTAWLQLGPSSRLLDVACGSGGPALHVARATGCQVAGIDLHPDGIAAANRMARERGLESRAQFSEADAAGTLPFEGESFDAILCVDAINHLRGRAAVLAEWRRLLAPGGRLVFTDPITVTGPLDSEEIAVRASIGTFLFVPPGVNERLLAGCGLRLLALEDGTDNVAAIAGRRHDARARRAEALVRAEGAETFEGQQRFLAVASALAAERRLSRLVYLAERPT
jgi:SAM-dependent methyltransferase